MKSVLIFVALALGLGRGAQPQKKQKLLLISFDGFRYDLLNASLVPSMARWANEGSWFVNGVQSQHLTVTAPNHHSIVTGLRENEHGIVGNFFYDTALGRRYDAFNDTQQPGIVEASEKNEWYGGTTIWQANQRAGGHSAVFNWPGGNAEGAQAEGVHYEVWREHDTANSTRKAVDSIVAALIGGANLVGWYVDQPDTNLHHHGFYDGELVKTLTMLDRTFLYLIAQLKVKGLLSSTNIILTADHGHAQVSTGKGLCVNRALAPLKDGVDYHAADHSIFPTSEDIGRTIFETLNKTITERSLDIALMWKKNIPTNLHWSHPTRVGAIYLQPQPGTDMGMLCHENRIEEVSGTSAHGYDPKLKEMRALLVMNGPAFRKGAKIEEVPENIDLYGLMAGILGFEAPPNSGRAHTVKKALNENATGGKGSTLGLIAIILMAAFYSD